MTRPRKDIEPPAERVARDIALRIDEGSLASGVWLRQETLADDFGVSRMTIRDAIQRLLAQGLVEMIPNRGARIRNVSERDIQEIYEVRAELEGLAAELAAKRATSDQLARLDAAEKFFAQTVSEYLDHDGPLEDRHAREWSEAHDRFNDVIYEAACNERLRLSIDDLLCSFPRSLVWQALGTDCRLLRENVSLHRELREAIDGGDGPAARRLMTDQLSRAGELLALRAVLPRTLSHV